jgi:hypothetical protein
MPIVDRTQKELRACTWPTLEKLLEEVGIPCTDEFSFHYPTTDELVETFVAVPQLFTRCDLGTQESTHRIEVPMYLVVKLQQKLRAITGADEKSEKESEKASQKRKRDASHDTEPLMRMLSSTNGRNGDGTPYMSTMMKFV